MLLVFFLTVSMALYHNRISQTSAHNNKSFPLGRYAFPIIFFVQTVAEPNWIKNNA